MGAEGQLRLRLVVVIIAVSAPLALGVETLLRTLVLAPLVGPAFNELREFFSPQLTRFCWALVPICVLTGVLGIALMLVGRRRARGSEAEATGADDPERGYRRVRDRLLLLTSIPQVPAILATLCFMAGSSLTPVLVCMGISTGFVLVQGLVGDRLLAELARA